jgi:molecular chaperone Hsp33
MSDSSGILLRATAAGETVRALAAVTTGVVEEARQRHGTFPTATAALGRTLTAGLLLGATMKDEERLSIEIVGDGPLRRVMVTTDGDGRVRGYVTRPETHLPPKNGKLDVAGAVGEGLLSVMRTQPWNKEPYRSVMKLVSGEIAEDITHYLSTSEQMPSATALGVFVNADGTVGAAGGFLVQILNGAASDLAGLIERNVAALPHVTSLIRNGEGPREILEAVLHGLELRAIGDQPVRFGCSCTRERVLGAILLLGKDEIEDMIRTEGRAEVRCEFCAEQYVVDRGELEVLVQDTVGTA